MPVVGLHEAMNGLREAMNGLREAMNGLHEAINGLREAINATSRCRCSQPEQGGVTMPDQPGMSGVN
jgi:hypothetical protein